MHKQKGAVEIILVLLLVVVIVAVGWLWKQRDQRETNPPTPPTISNPIKEPPAPEHLRNTFLPVWQEEFMIKNGIKSKTYFNDHIEIENVFLHDWNDGTSMDIRYLVHIDWATARLTDSILIKPKGEEDYLTPDEVKENLLQRSGMALLQYRLSRLLPVESVLPYQEVIKRLKTQCHSSLEPNKGEIFIQQGIKQGYGEMQLSANGVVNEQRNECKSALIRLSDGEINLCTDSPCRIY